MSIRLGISVLLIVVFAVAIASQLGITANENLRFRSYESQNGVTPSSSSAKDPNGKISRSVYVPAYSHIYGNGGSPYLLEITLSIRNIDPKNTVTVDAVKYYNTSGKLVKVHLDHPHKLEPLATMEFLVEEKDTSGGSGANFIVNWSADYLSNPLLIEAVMVGTGPNSSFSFVRNGIDLVD